MGIRHDERGLHVVLIALIVIVIVVLAAVMVVAWTSRDVTDGGVPPDEAIAEIVITCKIGDIDNQPAQVEVRDVSFNTKVKEFESGGFFEGLNWDPASWYYVGGEFEVTLKVTVKGPNDFLEDGLRDVQKIQIDEWDWGKRSLSFKTLRCRVPENGDYWVYAEIIVDSDNEGVENEVAWTKNKRVQVVGF